MSEKDEEHQLRIILQNTATTEERTRKIEKDIESLQARYVSEANRRDQKLAEVEKRVNRNEVILSGGLATLAAGVTAFLSRMAGLINF